MDEMAGHSTEQLHSKLADLEHSFADALADDSDNQTLSTILKRIQDIREELSKRSI